MPTSSTFFFASTVTLPPTVCTMDPHSMDRTARWVQAHSNPRALQGSQHHTRLKRQDGQSASQQSSRTDLGAPEHAAGSNGRTTTMRPRPTVSVLAVAGSTQDSHLQSLGDEEQEPLSRPAYGHHRSRSQPNSLTHDRQPRPQLNLPDKLYQKAPAFVQGPPGSGYPMVMSTAEPPTSRSARVVLRGPPSPPPQVPTSLNPKVRVRMSECRSLSSSETTKTNLGYLQKSRPTVQRRRPSLSGATFEEPPRVHSPLQPRTSGHSEPRVQGQADVRRVRGRTASESRRR